MLQSLTRRVLDPPAFGLDISDLTVKFVRISSPISSRRAAIEYFGEITLPPGLLVDGEIKNEKNLSKTLGELLRSCGVRHRVVVASLPEEKSFVRVLEVPRMKPDDVGKAIGWELEGIIPLPVSDIVYDFEVGVSSSLPTDHLDVLVTAFPKLVVESYERVLTGAGLVIRAMELESQAISRALLSSPSTHPPVVVLDLGAARTSFIIFGRGSLLFTKSVEIGGRDFEKAISSAMNVSIEEARRLKIEIGLNKHYAQGKIFQALEPLVSALAKEIEATVRFYRDHPSRAHAALGDVESVVLVGGDANLIGLGRYLSIAVRLSVAAGYPFQNLNFGPGAIPPIPKNEALKYTTAIGLALRATGQ